jgi:hypothetical protein
MLTLWERAGCQVKAGRVPRVGRSESGDMDRDAQPRGSRGRSGWEGKDRQLKTSVQPGEGDPAEQ